MVEIIRVGAGEAHLLSHVADDVFDGPIDQGRLAAYLAEPGHLMLVAVESGVVVAQARAIVHRHPDEPTELYVDNLGVAEDHRRQGVARRLMNELFAWGRALGCEEAWVGTEPENVEANGLYQSLGSPIVPMVMFEYEF